jgi:hypothetical protein
MGSKTKIQNAIKSRLIHDIFFFLTVGIAEGVVVDESGTSVLIVVIRERHLS